MTLPVEVAVYEADNTTLVASLTHDATASNNRQVRDLSGKVALDDSGDGKLVVDYDHPRVSTLTEGRWVQVTENSRVPFSFRVGERVDVNVPQPGGSDKDKVVTVTGEGTRSILKLGRVLPWMPVGSVPLSRRRRFDWSSPLLDTTDWTAVYDQDRLTSEPGKPFGLPSLFKTKWIAGEVEDDPMTIGDTVFRRQFTMADAATVSFFASWDDGGSQHLEGVELQAVDQVFPAKVWHQPWRAAVALEASATAPRSSYVYAARLTNDGGKAAFICDAWTTTETGLIDQVFMTGLPEDDEFDALYGEWICYVDPAGEWFTPGEIMRILLEECQDRDELLDVTLDFDDTLDSGGNAWPKIEVEFDATATYADAVNVLEASWIDVGMSTEGLVLSAWNKDERGTATAIAVTSAAPREVQSDTETVDNEIGNDVLLLHDKGMYLYESPLSVLAYGRRPAGSLQVGSISDPVILDQIGAAYLSGRTNPSTSRVTEVVPTFDLDCEPGDTISVEGDTLRVMEIAYSLDPTGALRKVPVLSTPYEQARARAERSVERLIAQYGDPRSSAQIIDTGTQIPTGPIDPVELESWSWTLPEDLDPGWWDVAEENPQAWQPHIVKKACRLVALIAKADWAEPDGADGLTQVTTGETAFKLIVNGAPTVVPFVATLIETNLDDPTDPTVYGLQFILGEGILQPNDTVSVAPINDPGGDHINGSVAIWAVDV